MVIARSIQRDPACRVRLESLLAHMQAERVDLLDDRAAENALAQVGARQDLERGGHAEQGNAKELVALLRLGRREVVFPGYRFLELRDGAKEAENNGVLCQTGLELQNIVGCPFDCAYCPYTRFVCLRLDLENIVRRFVAAARARRSQSLYKLNNRSDTLGLEPELGLAPLLVNAFSSLPDKKLLLYSKGTGVEGLLDCDHRGRTIACFTLSPQAVASLMEKSAPPPRERIAAMGRLAQAGYPLRVRLSPIVPVLGWREAYRGLLRDLSRLAHPGMFTLWTLSMVSLSQLSRIVPLESLDQDLLERSRRAQYRLRGKKSAPFPHQVRKILYQELASLVREYFPEALVSLCLESPRLWKALAEDLAPRRGQAFTCNCGPHSLMA